MPIDKLEEISQALMVSPSYLMGWEESLSNIDLLDELLIDTEWSYESYSHCDENADCPLTDDQRISMWVDGTEYDACKKCAYNSGYYYLTNGRKYYKFEEKEFNALSACLKPYLLFRINEAISKKPALSRYEYELEEGIGSSTEPDYSYFLSNAAHARTDIEMTEGIDTSDDDIMDDEDF